MRKGTIRIYHAIGANDVPSNLFICWPTAPKLGGGLAMGDAIPE